MQLINKSSMGSNRELKLEIIYKPIGSILGYVNNTRVHPQDQIDQIKSSISEFGMCTPIGVHNDIIIYGHGRHEALKQLGYEEVPTLDLSHLTDAQRKAFIIADNKIALNAGWDEELLKVEIEALQDMDFDISLLGFDMDELNEIMDIEVEDINDLSASNGSLMEKFGIAPFSVFNARDGNWQNRKRYWMEKGIDSAKGRDESMTFNSNSIISIEGKDTSIFDPVLCEIGYQWFCPENGTILDPFAGGSVRGLMASFLDKHYLGVDLRQEQIDENNAQLSAIDGIAPNWVCGDSLNIKEIAGDDFKADLLFSCPPYADLEKYSDNPKDLSNMDYDNFIDIYSKIIKNCYDLLRDDTFAFWVIGEVRNKKGNYYNFVGDTIKAFTDAGFNYYNEAILVTAVGSTSLRAGKYMKSSRKLGKTHQNVLMFVKGDGKRASERCGELKMELIETLSDD